MTWVTWIPFLCEESSDMLSKEARKERNTAFWESFKKRMRSVKSSSGRSIAWIGYPTDVKDVYLRMETDAKGARVCFDIQPKDDGVRSILWEQMTELKAVMNAEMECEADWNEESHYLNDRLVSRIKWENTTVNFYRDEDLPKIEAFFYDILTRFDRFYQEYKEILINLAD